MQICQIFSAFSCSGDDLLVFFDVYDNKLSILRLWTVSQTKQAYWRRHLALWAIVNAIFSLFNIQQTYQFIEKKITGRLIDNEKKPYP